jgi:predicted tellurium resistance membrane protein TerC
MFDWIADPNAWIALATLTALEIVLGIDNIIFISILVARLPEHQRNLGRRLGLGLAMGTRILLLLSLAWIMRLTTPLFTVVQEISGRDLILIGGGLFLIAKATHEIHAEVEAREEDSDESPKPSAFFWVIAQIIVIDMVFSLDSIITAIGMAQDLEIMIAAVIIACVVMYVSSGPVARFVAEHPTTKMLALAFLLLIGVTLVADGLGVHVPKGYIYSAMAFAVLVESFNIFAQSRRKQKKAPK